MPRLAVARFPYHERRAEKKIEIFSKDREIYLTKFSLFDIMYRLSVSRGGIAQLVDPLLAGQVLSQLSYTPVYLGQDPEN